MRQKLFQTGKAMDILSFRDKGSQRSHTTYRKIFGIVGQLLKELGYFLLYSFDSRRQSCKPLA